MALRNQSANWWYFASIAPLRLIMITFEWFSSRFMHPSHLLFNRGKVLGYHLEMTTNPVWWGCASACQGRHHRCPRLQKKLVSLDYFFFCKEKRKLFVNKRCQASSRTSAAICTSESVWNLSFTFWIGKIYLQSRTTNTQWRHKSKISEKLGRCGRQNMLRPYLKIREWELILALQ